MLKTAFSITSFPAIKRTSTVWLKFIGSPSVFSLERRIFHSISIGLILLVSIYIPYNYFAGLLVGSFSAAAIGLIFFYQYYYSRFRNKAHSNLVFGLTGLLIFSVNYFANAGINGSTDLIWPIYLLLVFAISPYRQHLTWLLLYLLTFAVLHLVEYYYPSLVSHPFDAGKGQFIDRITAIPMPVIAIYIITGYLRKNYDKERAEVLEKALAIKLKNDQISIQKEELEQNIAEKNKLMSILSHDLRAPLLNIQSYLELLDEMPIDDTERHMIEKELLNATNLTVYMLSNLLNWSRSQMEGITVNLQTVNLASALKSTLEIEKILAAKKGIMLCCSIDHDIVVIADTNMLQLVIRNLVNNAIKFSSPGGVIHVETQQIDNECKLTVSDNGKGIEADRINNLFCIKTGPTYGTNNEKGVGLGLVLCKEFIERQGGRIGVNSMVSRGSTFFVYMRSADK